MTFADRILAKMDPVISDDLDIYVRAICDSLFQEIEDYASDGPNDEQGWSGIVDLNRVPDKGLDWLAQFIGVHFPAGLTAAQKKTRIQQTDGWQRGSPSAIIGAALPYLTGTQTVLMRERDPAASPLYPAYGLTVITKLSETPTADWPTTNLVPNPSFEVDTSGWAPQVGTETLAAPSTAEKKFGNKSMPVTTLGGIAAEGARMNSVVVTGNQSYTASIYVKGSGTLQITLNERDVADANIGETIGAATVLTSDWQRLSVSRLFGVAGVKARIKIITSSIQAVTFYVDGAQLEAYAVPTAFVDVARLPGQGPVGAALLEQKPAGILLNYIVLAGQDYQILLNNHALYSNVYADYATYRGVANDTPGG